MKTCELVKNLVDRFGIDAVADAAFVTPRTVKLSMTSKRNLVSNVRWHRARIKLESAK